MSVPGPLYLQLPVAPDQGLPQAFSCAIGGTSYDFGLYANLTVPDNDPPDTIYDLSGTAGREPQGPPGFLVLRIARPGPAGPEVLLLRKLVPEPGLVHYAAGLAVKLTTARIARGNLNGVGHFGTQILIGVASRWV